MVVDYH